MLVCHVSISESVPKSCCSPSFSTDLLQLSFGVPLFLFLVGIHLIATFGIEVGCILNTCPIHCHFLLLITWDRGVVFVLIYSSSLKMVFGQNMRSNLQRHRVWKVSTSFLCIEDHCNQFDLAKAELYLAVNFRSLTGFHY